MATHDPHQGAGRILHDGCERCEEHASHPFASLDDAHLAGISKISKEGGWPEDCGELDMKAAMEVQSIRYKAQRLLKLGVF